MIANRPHERGNVMFYILIAVALLAALIFAVAQSGRGSLKAVSDEKARIFASEILDYNNSVSTAVAQLRLRGCKIEELSFENLTDATYTNVGAPPDKSCHIFELNGGGITFNLPTAEAVSTAPGKQLFTTDYEINEIGSDCDGVSCTEMTMISGPLKKEVCDQINIRLAVTQEGDTTPEDNGTFSSGDEFIGTVTYDTTLGSGVGTERIRGKTAVCVHDASAPGNYYFIKTLISR